MPKLIAICYRLLNGEASAVEAAENNEIHDFGGELVLTFDDGEKSFISWVNDPVQYAIGTKDASHFVPDAELADYDVSDTSMWASLIGQDVSLSFIAANNQVLKVSSAADHVLLCSYERGGWWADEVTVCRQAPAPYGA
ncbi:hypothetical protein GCM10023307_11850 [Lysobacter hankyongensis]|uniref:Uncharacterized protein n=2 Tax=Lysobacter hankyongensis TaxID=1176535 RepID=A0ABP9B0A9_9GAMM